MASGYTKYGVGTLVSFISFIFSVLAIRTNWTVGHAPFDCHRLDRPCGEDERTVQGLLIVAAIATGIATLSAFVVSSRDPATKAKSKFVIKIRFHLVAIAAAAIGFLAALVCVIVWAASISSDNYSTGFASGIIVLALSFILLCYFAVIRKDAPFYTVNFGDSLNTPVAKAD